MITAILCLLAAVLVGLTYKWATRSPEFSATDILPFLRKIDIELVYGTFHPEAEEQFRQRVAPEEFPRMQFKRIDMAIHYCRELAHNARFFQRWAVYEKRHNWQALDETLQRGVTEMRVQCMRCRIASFYVRTRLRWWLLRMRLLPHLPPPSFQDLARHGSLDMVSFYDTARELAEAFSQAYGEDYHGKLMQAL
jgi:hypothetical protein